MLTIGDNVAPLTVGAPAPPSSTLIDRLPYHYAYWPQPTKVRLTLAEANHLRELLRESPDILAKLSPAIEVEFPTK